MSKQKIAHGDFQTPLSLAESCCVILGTKIAPQYIVEPTCGVGAFIHAASSYFGDKPTYIGFDINQQYIELARETLSNKVKKLQLECEDFFSSDFYESLLKKDGPFLLLGNPPWVTSSTLGAINFTNSPEKKARFKNGFDNISGKSNFDISEWMLEQLIRKFSGKNGIAAFIIKSSVARKLFQTFSAEKNIVAKFYRINALKEFGVSVDAGFFVLDLNQMNVSSSEFIVYGSLEENQNAEKIIVTAHGRLSDKKSQDSSFKRIAPPVAWRSGLKHDCSKVMEFMVGDDGALLNGFGKEVDIEADLLYPLLKSSDIANGRLHPRKMVLVTQKLVGQETDSICGMYPKTWKYLLEYGEYLDARKSSIYKKAPRFSIFGIGTYSFKPWKVAISGLYKKISFQLIGPVGGKPCMLDDTCYFIACDSELEAKSILKALNSEEYLQTIDSIIFWDSKRPITSSVLNSIDYSSHPRMIIDGSSNKQLSLEISGLLG